MSEFVIKLDTPPPEGTHLSLTITGHPAHLDAFRAELDNLKRDAARYRWVRTHQYLGAISHEDPCDAASPAAIQFDRMIDRLMEAT